MLQARLQAPGFTEIRTIRDLEDMGLRCEHGGTGHDNLWRPQYEEDFARLLEQLQVRAAGLPREVDILSTSGIDQLRAILGRAWQVEQGAYDACDAGVVHLLC